MDKINAAYAFGDRDEVPGGGPGLAIRTIEANFGIRIDFFAEVDFNGFIKIIDTVGGVMIDVPYPIKDDAYPADGTNYMRVYFSAGWQHMDGKRALQYARTRHDDGDGRRSVRQQQVLLALREQALSLDLLPKAGELIAELGDAVRTDLSPTQALKLARLASEIQQNGIAQYSLDRALTEEQLPDEPYYLIADWDVVGQILSDFTGQPVTPPMSALAHPNYSLSITVENGTTNPGLGQRVASVLQTNGFTNVTATDRSSEVEHTRITAPPEELSTAYLVAGLIGIDINAVEIARGGAQARLQIVLGSDAHDPAYFTIESFDEPADRGNGSSTDTGASSEGISDGSPAQMEMVTDDGSGTTLGSDTGEGGGVSLGGDTDSGAPVEEEPTIAPSE
jgi:LCP family protein required for cell wall assembly